MNEELIWLKVLKVATYFVAIIAQALQNVIKMLPQKGMLRSVTLLSQTCRQLHSDGRTHIASMKLKVEDETYIADFAEQLMIVETGKAQAMLEETMPTLVASVIYDYYLDGMPCCAGRRRHSRSLPFGCSCKFLVFPGDDNTSYGECFSVLGRIGPKRVWPASWP